MAGVLEKVDHRVAKRELDPSGFSRSYEVCGAANAPLHGLRLAQACPPLDRGAPIRLVASTIGRASIAKTGQHAHARPTDSSSRYRAV